MRLQVFLSQNGVCSRRKAMDIIKNGNVKVNGKIIKEPSENIDEKKDIVSVKGRLVQSKQYDYIMLNKPAGYVTSKADKFAKNTVYDLLPSNFKYLSPVGRLDKDTEGLLIFTNDGKFAYKLTHPSFNLEKVYFVVVNNILMPKDLFKLENGVIIDGKKTTAAKINGFKPRKNDCEFFITIHEGRKRQIRRMVERVGGKVVYLKRVAQGKYKLGNLKVGKWRKIKI